MAVAMQQQRARSGLEIERRPAGSQFLLQKLFEQHRLVGDSLRAFSLFPAQQRGRILTNGGETTRLAKDYSRSLRCNGIKLFRDRFRLLARSLQQPLRDGGPAATLVRQNARLKSSFRQD